jgi:hypothetical protein
MKNWQTTLAGLGAGALNLFANGTDPKQIAFSVGMALLGTLAQDSLKKPAPPAEPK